MTYVLFTKESMTNFYRIKLETTIILPTQKYNIYIT